MFRFSTLCFAAVLVAVGGFALVGCSSKPAAAPAADDRAAKETSSASVPEGFEKLSDADRAAALAQKTCPVSGEKLGGMGTPFKVSVKGRDVFLCCPSCKDDLLKDPDKYLAKLDAK
ncbi:MAG TPA: TRASH domain-containing protein [Lacipirellulaceae bacterium]